MLRLILLLIISNNLLSQPWIDKSSNNFYQIQKDFYKYEKTAPLLQKNGKVPGWKQFKRWEWFWEQRVYPTGKFPAPDHLIKERINFEKKMKRSPSLQATADPSWTNLGPTSSPGGYNGLGRLNCIAVDPNDANELWVGAASGGLWKSTDAGANWTTNTDDFASLGVTGIAINPDNTDIMYIATGDGFGGDTYSTGVLKSTDGGETWSSTGLSYSTSSTVRLYRLLINPDNPNILYVCGNVGVYKTVNGGSTWSQMTSGGVFYDMEFKPDDPNTIWACNGTYIYKSIDAGSNWAQQASSLPTNGTQRIALAVTAANSNYVYALYANNTNYGLQGVYRTVDGGTNWTEQEDNTNDWLGYYSDGSVAGGQGFYDLCIEVDPSNANTVYIGGINIVKSVDGGVNWNTVATWTSSGVYNKNASPEVHADQHALQFSPNGTTLYNCNDGGLYSTVNGGTSWNWLGNDLEITQFYRIGTSLTNANKVIGGCQDNGTKLYAGSWSDVIGGDGMECHINSEDESIMFGAIQNGDIRRSLNGGSSFSSIFTGNGENAAWVTPYTPVKSNQSTLFAGYQNVYKSVDDGSNWASINGTTNIGTITSLATAPSNADFIYISDGSNVRYTSNGGTNWNDVTKPGTGSLTRFAIHPKTPTTLWCTLSGYNSGNKVFKSTDSGQNWTNISGSLPNIPANCITHEGGNDNLLYVGTDVGMYYRSDNDSDWRSYNEGLPNVIITDIEIVSSRNKLNAATYGRGLWQAKLVTEESNNSDSNNNEEEDQDGVSAIIESAAPNSGDGNGDGISDALQSTVASLLNEVDSTYITLESLDGFDLANVQIADEEENSLLFFPFGAVKFDIPESNVEIKLYYHGISSLDGFIYRKLANNNEWFTFQGATFGQEEIDGNTVATVVLRLRDGGLEDYDGLVNGVIVDPGGPAIPIASIIPVWDEKWYLLSILLIISIVIWKQKLISV